MAKEYNTYIVEYECMHWEFDHWQNALDFVKSMWAAKGDVKIILEKIAPEVKGESEELPWQET